MKYFSDIEGVNKGCTIFRISIDAWNGIATIVNSLICNNLLSKDYPKQCPDGNGICGVNEQSFYIAAIAVIPGIKDFLPQFGGYIQYLSNNTEDPFGASEDVYKDKTDKFTYDVLDFVEFVFKHIHDVQNGKYHDFFRHYELDFPDTTHGKDKYVSEINEILERNHIGFTLRVEGTVQRVVNEVLLHPIAMHEIEPKLKELITDAIERFRSPKEKERIIALEKLWDAFERLKTIEIPTEGKKKQSLGILLSKASFEQHEFNELLENECKSLTEIGNKYQIRHFEMSKKKIIVENHLDYLFYRMYAIISLLLTFG